MFSEIKDILQDLMEGHIVCIADSEELENEIDLCCLAKHATTHNINRMITNARGLVCCSMSAALCDAIGFQPMASKNIKPDKLGTPFYNSVDLDNGSTGVSAKERGNTARHIAGAKARLEDFVSPGHLFTLRARPGLLHERKGHTEGCVQLAKLCGEQAAVICEIIKEDGEMLRVEDFEKWNQSHHFKLCTIEQIERYANQ